MRVFFVGVGEKVLKLSFVNLVKVQGDESVHPVLNNSKLLNESKLNKSKAVRYRSLPQLIENFLLPTSLILVSNLFDKTHTFA